MTSDGASSPVLVTTSSSKSNAITQNRRPRTSIACRNCRDKKVKCSGRQPCLYCSKRSLDCVFTNLERKRVYSTAEVEELHQKLARYEDQQTGQSTSQGLHLSPAAVSTDGSSDLHAGTSGVNSGPRTNILLERSAPLADSREPAVTLRLPSVVQTGDYNLAIAPASALSSSDMFGHEVKTLLATRSSAISTTSPSIFSAFPSTYTDRYALLSLPHWPDGQEAQALLETYILHVGISQQIFDPRFFLDKFYSFFQETETQIPGLWIVKMLMVFAISRLLQGRAADASELPNTALFREAIKHLPGISEMRRQGILGVEVLGLFAIYLQIVDRKEDAYIYISTALRLAVMRGMHRDNSNPNGRRSEIVHSNRLWWSIYMQERRLAAAGGFPNALPEDSINASLPSDYVGFTPATAILINIKVARILGQVTTTIYSQSSCSERSFIFEIQRVLSSLYQVESTMPAEYRIDFQPTSLLVAGRPFAESSIQTARTACSLYLSVYQTVIYTIRPVLLHLAKHALKHSEDIMNEPSATQIQLAGTCVEAARKSLAILQNLKDREIIAKHAFLDLDAIFSVGFIYVLVEVINPGKHLGDACIDNARAILQYLVSLGNKAAAKRMAELDQMCELLAVPVPSPVMTNELPDREQTSRPGGVTPVVGEVTRSSEMVNSLHNASSPAIIITGDASLSEPAPQAMNESHNPQAIRTDNPAQQSAIQHNDELTFGSTDPSDLNLEEDNDLYWMYHPPGFDLTGVEHQDWERLASQLTWSE